MELHAKVKGALGEAKVAAQLISKGYPVFTEFGDNSKVDLIALVDRKPVKIQVKSFNAENGMIPVRNTKSGPNYRFTYDPEDFDVLAVYALDRDAIYFVSSERLFKTGYLTLRIDHSKNNQTKGCNLASEFVNFENALRDYTPNIQTDNAVDNDIVQTATTCTSKGTCRKEDLQGFPCHGICYLLQVG